MKSHQTSLFLIALCVIAFAGNAPAQTSLGCEGCSFTYEAAPVPGGHLPPFGWTYNPDPTMPDGQDRPAPQVAEGAGACQSQFVELPDSSFGFACLMDFGCDYNGEIELHNVSPDDYQLTAGMEIPVDVHRLGFATTKLPAARSAGVQSCGTMYDWEVRLNNVIIGTLSYGCSACAWQAY